MATVLEYMQLATRVYASSVNNVIDVPTGWRELDWQPDRSDGPGVVKFGDIQARGSSGFAKEQWERRGTDSWFCRYPIGDRCRSCVQAGTGAKGDWLSEESRMAA